MSKRRSKEDAEISDFFARALVGFMVFSGLLAGMSLIGQSTSFIPNNWPPLYLFGLGAALIWILLEKAIDREQKFSYILIKGLTAVVISFVLGCVIILVVSWSLAGTIKDLPHTFANVVPVNKTSANDFAGLSGQPATMPVMQSVNLATPNPSSPKNAENVSQTQPTATVSRQGKVAIIVDLQHPTYQNSKVTVTGELLINDQPVAGAQMATTWHYTTISEKCVGTSLTNANGESSCTVDTNKAYRNKPIIIDVVMTYQGQSYSGQTTITPQ